MKHSHSIMTLFFVAAMFSTSAHAAPETCTREESTAVLKRFVTADESVQDLLNRLGDFYKALLTGNRQQRIGTSPVFLIEYTKAAACLSLRITHKPNPEIKRIYTDIVEKSLKLIAYTGPTIPTEKNHGILENDITSIMKDNTQTIAEILYYQKLLNSYPNS